MSEPFFIGRETELEKLEQFVFSNPVISDNPKISHIWGSKGIGKSAFMNRFASLLIQENDAILWFYPKFSSLKMEVEEFYLALMGSVDSNLGDLEPWLIQISNLNYIKESEPAQNYESSWAKQLAKILATAQKNDFLNLNDLRIIFLIDDFSELPREVRNSFCNFISELNSITTSTQQISVTLSGENELLKTPDIFGYWESFLNDSLEIQIENLTHEETKKILDAHNFDPSLIQKIYQETHGVPALLNEAINDLNLQTQNSEEWYNRGKNLLRNFNTLQRKWLKWAALIKVCNEETLSMVANGAEKSEAMYWIHASYPNYFQRNENEYSLSQEHRRAILAYVEKDDYPLFEKTGGLVKQFLTVTHAIPNANHRLLLSLLSELQYFDTLFIKKLFDNKKASAMLDLLEKKPIFFKEDTQVFRLASNTRSSITLYNSLLQFNDRKEIQKRMVVLWKERKKLLDKNLKNAENDLHEYEQRNKSLSISSNKMQEEIERLEKSRTKSSHIVEIRPIIRKKSASRWIIAFLLQSFGLSILYINILFLEQVSLSYLLLSALCIVAGITYGMKGQKQETVTLKREIRNTEQQQLEKILKNVERDHASLLSEKEKTRAQVEMNKSKIITIQNFLKQSYLPHSEDSYVS